MPRQHPPREHDSGRPRAPPTRTFRHELRTRRIDSLGLLRTGVALRLFTQLEAGAPSRESPPIVTTRSGEAYVVPNAPHL